MDSQESKGIREKRLIGMAVKTKIFSISMALSNPFYIIGIRKKKERPKIHKAIRIAIIFIIFKTELRIFLFIALYIPDTVIS